jgi:hypothetical protein
MTEDESNRRALLILKIVMGATVVSMFAISVAEFRGSYGYFWPLSILYSVPVGLIWFTLLFFVLRRVRRNMRSDGYRT